MTLMMEPVVETRTARKKRLKAERGGKPKRSGAAELQSLKARFLQRCCSEYWFYQRAAGQRTPIGILCRCEACVEARRFAWPRPHIGSAGISFECFLERNEIPSEEPQKATEGDARAAGLTIKPHRHRGEPPPAAVLVAGCEGCEDGMKPRADRFCLKCAARIRQEMIDVGYLTPQSKFQ